MGRVDKVVKRYNEILAEETVKESKSFLNSYGYTSSDTNPTRFPSSRRRKALARHSSYVG